MKNFKIYALGMLFFSLTIFQSCEDCTISPDLISDLKAPSSAIIQGEPVDWDYLVTSVEESSQDCGILQAIASVGKIVIDFFSDPSDPQGDMVLNNQNNIGALDAGESEAVSNSIDVFNDGGIYLLTVTADATEVVEEREENNNTDTEEVDTRSLLPNDPFQNASRAFKEKLANAAAIVIVGHNFNEGVRIDSYKGKPIYYAQ